MVVGGMLEICLIKSISQFHIVIWCSPVNIKSMKGNNEYPSQHKCNEDQKFQLKVNYCVCVCVYVCVCVCSTLLIGLKVNQSKSAIGQLITS